VRNLHSRLPGATERCGLYRGFVMKVAVAQFSAGKDKVANLHSIAGLAEQAAGAGAQVVVFPEAAMSDFGARTDDLASAAEPLDGPFVSGMSRLAARLGLTLAAGMFESIPGDHRVYNTLVVADPKRGLTATYRKRHLYDAFGDKESARIRPGEEDPPLIELNGFMVALAICFDIRFPGFIDRLADRGADLLLLPSAWVAGPLKEEHWSVLTRARAIDNTMYVAAAGQTGTAYCGRSVIVDPLGVVVAGLGEAEGVAVAEISHERLRHARARLPLVAQRRPATEGAPRG
jgi:deaminated glutathione amidase